MESFLQIMEVQHILVLVMGVLIGIIVGSLPGLTPTMGVALCIPFTFSLPPLDGLMLLGGIFCGSIYGGAIPAIMFNVPGAPASVATTFDGYPMAQKGKTRKALELTTISSCIGGLFGMGMLIFFAPLFLQFSLQFGPSESFWIALFGISVIAAISEGSITKELFGGAIGIFLSFIGMSSFTGLTRFTLGIDSLVGGLHVVAVLIGLFAFPQALRIIENFSKDTKPPKPTMTTSQSSIIQSFKDVFKSLKSLTIGSVVGGVVGVIPGAGGNIASILAYNEAKRFSKHKEKFGKGHNEGIIASESANNALVGGSLIPLLTLGIPGSPTAAIFLGGLLIHGIWPGRSLFVDNAHVVYGFFTSMVLAQLLILVIGLASVKYLTQLSRIPSYFMAPIILSLCIVGAYATQNNIVDIYTIVVIGVLMYVLQKFHFSPAPIALGFILGPIAEEGLLQGIYVGTAKGAPLFFFFDGIWNLILISLIILTITLSILQSRKKKKENRPQTVNFRFANYLSIHGFGWLFTILIGWYGIVFTSTLTFEQGLFPQITFIALTLFAMMEWIKIGFKQKNIDSDVKDKMNPSLIMFLSLVCMICLLTSVIGFYVQVITLMLLSVSIYLYYQKGKKMISIRRALLVSISFTLIMYFIFTGIVKVPLPSVYQAILHWF